MNEIAAAAATAPNSAWGWIVFLFTGLAALGVGLPKVLKGWASDRRSRIADDAVSETVQMLREQNETLRRHNAELVTVFQEAQTRIVTIAGENQRLQTELESLKLKLAHVLREHGLDVGE